MKRVAARFPHILVTFRHLFKPGFLDAPQDGDKIEQAISSTQPIRQGLHVSYKFIPHFASRLVLRTKFLISTAT
jgi:hypothetical protein